MANDTLGVRDGRLAPCPASPNCVSSDAADPSKRVDPLRLRVDAERAWEILQGVLAGMPRTSIVRRGDDYLHAEARTLIFRFVDDVEFHLRPSEGVIAVRSASRVGYSDLGVNRRRVDEIRDALRRQGVVD